MANDHRRGPRRRGEALEAAILQAAFDELVEVGYAGLTMDRVAARAHTSKASLYRRWPTRVELAVHAVFHTLLPDPGAPPDTGSLRGDLLALLRRSAQLLAGPAGEVVRAVLSETLPDPQRVAELHRFSSVVEQGMHEVVRRAISRGEIVDTAVTPRRLEAGQALLRQHFLFNGPVVPDTVIVEIADEVVIPLLSQFS
jgi:AcrR family transcriptional regulator